LLVFSIPNADIDFYLDETLDEIEKVENIFDRLKDEKKDDT